MEQEIAVRPQTSIEGTAQKILMDVLARNKGAIEGAVGRFLDSKRFGWLVVSQIRANPKLVECSPYSFMNAVMLAAQMGIEIRRDSAYLIPFGRECQLLIDYKAKAALARRGGKIGGIQAITIRERDDFKWEYGPNGIDFHHKPFAQGIASPEERGNIMGVYSFAQIIAGGMQFREPMSLQEIDRIRKRSRAGVSFMKIEEIFDAGKFTADGKQMVWQTWEYKDKRRQPWVTDFEQMALKTSLNSLFKGLPLEPAAQLSQDVDHGFETGNQPNVIGEVIEIDPADDKPMISPAETHEEYGRIKGQIVEVKTNGKVIPNDPWVTLVGRFGQKECLALLKERFAYEEWEAVPAKLKPKIISDIDAQLSAELPPQ